MRTVSLRGRRGRSSPGRRCLPAGSGSGSQWSGSRGLPLGSDGVAVDVPDNCYERFVRSGLERGWQRQGDKDMTEIISISSE